MAAERSIVLIVVFVVFCFGVKADAESGEEIIRSEAFDSSGLKVDVEQLKSKIHALERENSRIALDLKHKDVIIYEKDSVIKEKTAKVDKLQKDLTLIQGKETNDAEEKVAKSEARAADLEKQVARVEAEIGKQIKEKETVEARESHAKKQISELTSKLEELQKMVDTKQAKIKRTERALRAAEDEILKIKSQANSKIEELLEAHGAWLPPWLGAHVLRYQGHWNEHGKPVLDSTFQKALEKKAAAEKWAQPHLEVVKTKFVPALKEYCLLIVARFEPHVKLAKAKSFDAFDTSKKALTPHIVKLHAQVDPYYQEAKKVTKPYIEHIASFSKPHVEKVKLALEPYTVEAVKVYVKFLEYASVYHSQVQVHVQEALKKHEWTKPFATTEFEWFVASAFLALPVIILFRILSSACGEKTKQPAKHGHHHGKRKAKRGHAN